MQRRRHRLQQLSGVREARLGDRAHDPRRSQLLLLGHAGIEALGRERDEHILADAQAALAQRLDEQLAGAPHVGGRRHHERLAGSRVAHDPRACAPQRFAVRVALAVDDLGTQIRITSAAWTASTLSLSAKRSSPM